MRIANMIWNKIGRWLCRKVYKVVRYDDDHKKAAEILQDLLFFEIVILYNLYDMEGYSLILSHPELYPLEVDIVGEET